MTHKELVERAWRWLRNSARIPCDDYGRPELTRKVQCGVVLTEYTSGAIEIPDAIGWAYCGRVSVLVECKASRSDFLADRQKFFRRDRNAKFGLGAYRYYLTNPGIATVDELPASWGLLEVEGRRLNLIHAAKKQDRDTTAEIALLWSECRKIQIVDRGGTLRETRHGKRVMDAFKGQST